MGVPIEGGSLEMRRRVSIRTKPGMRLPLQVQVGMKRPVVPFLRSFHPCYSRKDKEKNLE